MAVIEGLTYPTMVEHNGIMYVTGWRGGMVYFRKSLDGGGTWTDEKVIGAGEEARAGLVKMESGGRRLVAAVARGEAVVVYVSVDDGETWVEDGEV